MVKLIDGPDRKTRTPRDGVRREDDEAEKETKDTINSQRR